MTSFLGENDVIRQNYVMLPKKNFDQNAPNMLFVEYVEIGGPPKSRFFGIFDFLPEGVNPPPRCQRTVKHIAATYPNL